MGRAKYQFDKRTLTYKKVTLSVQQVLWRVLSYVAAGAVFSAIVLVSFTAFFDSPKEKQLKREIAQLELQYKVMNDRMIQMNQVLAELQEKDDNIYRVIFEAEPIPRSMRDAGFGGVNRYQHLDAFTNTELIKETAMRLDRLTKKMVVQSRSFDDVIELAKGKAQLLASIPAIQPVSNDKLTRIASGFNYRVHPIYKIMHFHTGIDFTAPTGTEIVATGDGKVSVVERESRGYGNHVVINHGFGYETLYAHMSRFKVTVGQKVKRGDVIGYVGSTGTSTAPHLHYEVIKNGEKINPINFFFNDLSAEEYDKVVEMSSRSNQSFD
jgi:murein DD-endopeptidase MepM/ murein hydrolase activator NlpD